MVPRKIYFLYEESISFFRQCYYAQIVKRSSALKLTGYLKHFERESLGVTMLCSQLKSCVAEMGGFVLKASKMASGCENQAVKNYEQIFSRLLPLLHEKCGESDECYKESKSTDKDFEEYFFAQHPQFKQDLSSRNQ